MVSVSVEFEPHIGIDLGTTNSCVALFNPQTQSVEVLANAIGKTITPSWVAMKKIPNQVIVGEAAANQLDYYHEVKRVIGKSYDEVSEDGDLLRHLPYELVEGQNGRCEIKAYKSQNTLTPEEISASVLKEMKKIAQNRCGREVLNAVITVPAYFNNSQKQATRDAAKIAGLNPIRIINEPTSACMACDFHRIDDMKNILVFDLGGGTYDISVITSSQGLLDVQATRGDVMLGGLDLDQAIVKICERRIQNELTVRNRGELNDDDIVPPPLDKKMIRRKLRLACEQAKITLSKELNAQIRVDKIVTDHPVYDDLDFQTEISRNDFEIAAQAVFSRLEQPLQKVLEDASMEVDEIDEIVIVGGSTRIPLIKEWLKEYFNTDRLHETLNADEGVAYGAAIMAGIVAGQLQRQKLPEAPQNNTGSD